MKTKLIAIVGPTASGKTGLGIALAKEFNGEVISVDSRQVYKGMDIGTAKTLGGWELGNSEQGTGIREQLFGARKTFVVEGIPHWGIDLVDPDEDYSAAQFKEYAEQKVGEIVNRGHVPILVGGTGMWLKALIDNLDLASTPSDPAMRTELESRRLGDLYHEYKQLDPAGAELIDKNNKRRVMRALEVTKLTGKPFSEMRTAGESKYEVLQIGISVDREELYNRINDRVDEMVARGLVDEVRGLKERFGCQIDAMTGIGYRQICEFLEGRASLKEAIVETKKATRHYAKRQGTWFRRDERVVWVDSEKDAFSEVGVFYRKIDS